MAKKIMFSIQEKINLQQTSEGQKFHAFKPLSSPIQPKSHTPLYKMHRYYARRPHNLFAHLIQYYSQAGDIVLDPFSGGGVTVVESLRLCRKVVGVDLNPLATLVTRMQVAPLDLDKFETAFNGVLAVAKEAILPLYTTTHPQTGEPAVAEWYEWSEVYRCSACQAEVVLHQAKKVRGGKYECTACHEPFLLREAEKLPDLLFNMCLQTEQESIIMPTTPTEQAIARHIEADFETLIQQDQLWYPLDQFPDGDRMRDDGLLNKGITHFYHFFTKRNLLANARLLKIIREYPCESNVKEFLYFCFSASLRFTNRMTFRSEVWRGGKTAEWPGHAYWVPNTYSEVNVYDAFVMRFNAIIRGKTESNEQIGEFCQMAQDYRQLSRDKTCLILNQSAHELPLPIYSVDVVITDPPFGGNVQYAELSDFWVVWLKDILGREGIIDNQFEAIQTRKTGFASAKSLSHYEDMLYRILKECHRVLKPQGWLVMTFHNRDLHVWMALHRAAIRAGFQLPSAEETADRGMIYQPPIDLYTTTFHQRATGSMLGDFILSFKRLDTPAGRESIQQNLTTEQEESLKKKIEELIRFHVGADDSTIMTGLIPALVELGVLHRVANFDWEAFLAAYFIKDRKTGKWYTHDLYDLKTKRLRPMDYIPAEVITRQFVVAHLKEHHFATTDEILNLIYTQLVNSHRPGVESINSVLTEYCESVTIKGKKGYILKPERPDVDPTVQLGFLGTQTLVNQNLSHNEIIMLLAKYAFNLGYQVHVGQTEQRKEAKLRDIGVSMDIKEEWGIAHEQAFDNIKEIDLLIVQGQEIPAAFEVATTIETADKAINNRFRDLFTILPNTKIRAFVVVRDEDFDKGVKIACSAANVQQGISERVRIIKISHLTTDRFEVWVGKQ